FCSARRSGDPCGRQCIISAAFPACAFSHLSSDGFADRSVCLESLRAHCEELLFGCVAVGNYARKQDRRSTRYVRQTMGNATAGAGFCQRQSLAPLRQNRENRRFNFLFVPPVDESSQSFPNNRLGLLEQLFGTLARGS